MSDATVHVQSMYEKDNDFMLSTNAVDDELIATNSNELCLQFLEFQQNDLMLNIWEIHWYLQGRLTQNEDYSVVLDQLQYMALIASRFLPQHDNTNVTKGDMTKHESPLPASFVPTKKDCATNFLEVQQLEQTDGFQYSSVIGTLIFLLNITTVLQYAIRKLACFNTLPRKKHFKALTYYIK